MKEINIDSPKYGIQKALVDEEDYDYLNQWKWNLQKTNRTFYARRNEYVPGKRNNPKCIFMHREILKLTTSKLQGDHIDHNGLNNQKNNLRIATKDENNWNKIAQGRSKYLGVYLSVRDCKCTLSTGEIKSYHYEKWHASIKINNKNKSLGYYLLEEDAARAYDKAAQKQYGRFANLNFPIGLPFEPPRPLCPPLL